MAWFSWTNQNSLLRIATNEIASLCIDDRLVGFFRVCQSGWGKGRLSRFVEIFWNKKVLLFRYYIKQIDSMLPCVRSVIDHRWCQKSIDEKQDKLIKQLQANQKAITSGLEDLVFFNQLPEPTTSQKPLNYLSITNQQWLSDIRDFKIHYGGLLLRLLGPSGTRLTTPFPPQTSNRLRFRCTATGCSASTCLYKNGYVRLYSTFIRQRLDQWQWFPSLVSILRLPEIRFAFSCFYNGLQVLQLEYSNHKTK